MQNDVKRITRDPLKRSNNAHIANTNNYPKAARNDWGSSGRWFESSQAHAPVILNGAV